MAVNDTSVSGKTMDYTTKLFKAKKESVKIQIRRVVKEKVTKRLSLASFDSRSSMTDTIMVRWVVVVVMMILLIMHPLITCGC